MPTRTTTPARRPAPRALSDPQLRARRPRSARGASRGSSSSPTCSSTTSTFLPVRAALSSLSRRRPSLTSSSAGFPSHVRRTPLADSSQRLTDLSRSLAGPPHVPPLARLAPPHLDAQPRPSRLLLLALSPSARRASPLRSPRAARARAGGAPRSVGHRRRAQGRQGDEDSAQRRGDEEGAVGRRGPSVRGDGARRSRCVPSLPLGLSTRTDSSRTCRDARRAARARRSRLAGRLAPPSLSSSRSSLS